MKPEYSGDDISINEWPHPPAMEITDIRAIQPVSVMIETRRDAMALLASLTRLIKALPEA